MEVDGSDETDETYFYVQICFWVQACCLFLGAKTLLLWLINQPPLTYPPPQK